MKEKYSLSTWALKQNIRLLDEKYYEDENLYTLDEYLKIVPRDVEVPLCNETWEDRIKANTNDLIKLENGEYGLVKDAVDTIIEIETEMNRLKELQDNYKKLLLEKMEEKNILKIDIPELTITRKAPTTRETLDSKKLKEDMPEIYDEYVKISDVKGSITIKVK